MRNVRIGLFVVGGLLVAGAVYLLSLQILTSTQSFRGSLIDPAKAAADFQLRTAEGSTFHLAAQQGKVVLIFFGFTHCDEECPATLAKMQNLYARLEDKASQVDIVLVTVDPQRDTPEIMADWVHQVNAGFYGLSGTEDDLRPIWDGFFVGQFIPAHEPDEDYEVDHSLRVYVVDKQGKLRLTFPYEMEAEDIAHDVSLLLAEN